MITLTIMALIGLLSIILFLGSICFLGICGLRRILPPKKRKEVTKEMVSISCKNCSTISVGDYTDGRCPRCKSRYTNVRPVVILD